jgi:hypothetical protein
VNIVVRWRRSVSRKVTQRKRKAPAKVTEISRGVAAGLEDAKAYLKGGKARTKVVESNPKPPPAKPKPKPKRRTGR